MCNGPVSRRCSAWPCTAKVPDGVVRRLRFRSLSPSKPPIDRNALLHRHFIDVDDFYQAIAFRVVTAYLMVVHLAILSIPQYGCRA